MPNKQFYVPHDVPITKTILFLSKYYSFILSRLCKGVLAIMFYTYIFSVNQLLLCRQNQSFAIENRQMYHLCDQHILFRMIVNTYSLFYATLDYWSICGAKSRGQELPVMLVPEMSFLCVWLGSWIYLYQSFVIPKPILPVLLISLWSTYEPLIKPAFQQLCKQTSVFPSMQTGQGINICYLFFVFFKVIPCGETEQLGMVKVQFT